MILYIVNSNILFGIEDHEFNIDFFEEITTPSMRICLLRSPENFFASRIRKAFQKDKRKVYPRSCDAHMERIVCLWKCYAKEFLGITRELSRPAVAIWFDRWFVDESYRQALSRSLNLGPFSDCGLEIVSSKGGGSSFDSVRYYKQAQNMSVLNRSMLLSPSEMNILNEVLSDQELNILSRKIKEKIDCPAPLNHFQLMI